MALAFPKAGANVVVTWRAASEVQSAVHEILSLENKVRYIGIIADVLDRKDQERLIHEV